MKKGLLIAGASVLLLGGLVAGVFARYQSTVDVAGGTIVAKDFVFTGEKNYADSYVAKLAPGENVDIGKITVMNYTSTITSEVDIKVVMTYTFSGDLYDGCAAIGDQLKFTVKDGATEVASGAEIVTLAKGVQSSKDLTVSCEWIDSIGTSQDNSAQNALIGKTATFSFQFVGTQA
jgi:hypothetical protein